MKQISTLVGPAEGPPVWRNMVVYMSEQELAHSYPGPVGEAISPVT